jgi:hypothetical protein
MPPVTGPYPAGTLKPPLTHAQRVAIIGFFHKQGYDDAAIWPHIDPLAGTSLDPSFPNLGPTYQIAQWIATGGALPDAKAIDAYNTVASGGFLGTGVTDTKINVPGAGVVSGIKDAGEAAVKIVSALLSPNTWIRIAEFGVGAILVGVGVSAMVKQATK